MMPENCYTVVLQCNTFQPCVCRRLFKGGSISGMCPSLEPNAQRKNLQRLKDLLDNINKLISKFLSQQLHNKIIYIKYSSIFRFKVAQNLIAEQ